VSEPATLLVADDDPGLRESLERTLTREGYRVLLAPDGNAALERLRGGGIDLVLTDLKMPGLSGLAVLECVRHTSPGTRVVVLSGFASRVAAEEALSKGADAFLLKPVDYVRLREAVNAQLEAV